MRTNRCPLFLKANIPNQLYFHAANLADGPVSLLFCIKRSGCSPNSVIVGAITFNTDELVIFPGGPMLHGFTAGFFKSSTEKSTGGSTSVL